MKTPRQKMPVRDAKERIKNFSSVALGFTEEQSVLEAKRCLQCKKPVCIEGCPVEIDIPKFIKEISEKKFLEAIKTIKEKNNLPAICGRVCPQETQCELKCILGKKNEPVAIGSLERFVADYEIAPPSFIPTEPTSADVKLYGGASEKGHFRTKVAVVGSGPAGLTCAGDLARMGYSVTVFESLHMPGGVLVYGIPEFRLPKGIVHREIDYVKSLGVEIKCNMVIGKVKSLKELFQSNYEAIFIGTGAGLPQFLNVPGENLCGIYSANEFLTRVNLMKAYLFPEYDTPVKIGKRVAVLGGGNVAMDSARVALRLGAEESIIVYRRTEKELPARREEVENAKEEGIKFHLLTAPVKFIGDEKNNVTGMECIKMELGEPDESGRRRPVPIPDSNFVFNLDTVVIAIGQSPNPLIPKSTKELKLAKKGNVIVDEGGRTSMEGVFAGGDISTGAATVIEAMGAGKIAARSIDEYLKVNRR
ncbi:MAG: glutamate synthase (NADPH), homotetrameric [Elusimicrobia bacterium CG02_land_8_20_14_3_00_37_13]|nr:MAG: glutamate synthase (NADPH), homotetrameric [Elusimicrobia bacterium CG02_land_8_20_14_3_00_37_13]